MRDHAATWRRYLAQHTALAGSVTPIRVAGRLTRINGLVMEAAGIKLPLGASCQVDALGGGTVEAEVVGFHGERLYMMPTDDVQGLGPGAPVRAIEAGPPPVPLDGEMPPQRRNADRAKRLPVGDGLLGRVLDGAGRPLDGLGPVTTDST